MASRKVTISVRIPAEMVKRVDTVAKRRRISRTDLVISALERELRREEQAEGKTLLEQFGPWVGSGHSGGKYPARDHKKLYAEYLEEKHFGRRRTH